MAARESKCLVGWEIREKDTETETEAKTVAVTESVTETKTTDTHPHCHRFPPLFLNDPSLQWPARF